MTDDCADAKKIKQEWLRDGADEIHKLPTEEGKVALMTWIEKRKQTNMLTPSGKEVR